MASLAWRLVAAVALVVLTYNPSGHSYYHWAGTAVSQARLGPEHYFVAVVLIIGWVMSIRATLRSLGGVGILLGAAFFATLMWVLTHYNIIPVDSVTAIVWIALLCMATLLATGMSWSHIRRRISG